MLYSATHVFVSSVCRACRVVAIDADILLSIFHVQLVTRFSVRLVGKAPPSFALTLTLTLTTASSYDILVDLLEISSCRSYRHLE